MRMVKWSLMGLSALAIAGAAYWYVSQPTLLAVRVVLAETGVDVTDATYVSVSVLREGETGPPTLANTRTIGESFDYPGRYLVPPKTPVFVSANARLLPAAEDVVTLNRGEDKTITLALDAGLITASILSDDDPSYGQRRLYLDEKFSEFGPEFPEDGELRLLLPPGAHRLLATHGLTTDTKDISLASGEVQELGFDTRLATVTVVTDFGDLYADHLPPAFIGFEHAEFGRFGAELDTSGASIRKGLRYGTYDLSLNFAHETARNTNIETVRLGQITIDASTETVTFAPKLLAVQVDVSGIPASDLTGMHAMLFAETGGYYYARGPINKNRAQLLFALRSGDAPDLNFYVAIRDSDTVISFQNVGQPVAGIPTVHAATPGGNRTVCSQIFPEPHCEGLNSP